MLTLVEQIKSVSIVLVVEQLMRPGAGVIRTPSVAVIDAAFRWIQRTVAESNTQGRYCVDTVFSTPGVSVHSSSFTADFFRNSRR